ncbi:MAG: PAS domain S-box protein [Candidatus Thorarchaeota archaeon]|nr:PAS domain S-box protein [Candidatus Thorarchaeota archaeon]
MSEDGHRQSLGNTGIPYQAIVDTMNDALIVLDENDVITYANHSFMELIGYRLSEIVGHHITDFVSEKEAEKVQKNNVLRRKGLSSQYQLDWTHWTGDRVHTIISATPILDAEGNYSGSFAVVTDITSYRIEQEKRIRNERRFRLLLESMNEAVAFISTKFILEYGNQRLFDLLGYPREEALGKSIYEFIDSTEYDGARNFLENPERELRSYELLIITKNKERIHTLVTPRPIINEQGEQVGFLGVLLDVSELKLKSQQLEETEARYEILFEEMPVGLISIDQEGGVINANRRAVDILGAPSLEELKSVNFLTGKTPKELGVAEALIECQRKKEPVTREIEYHTRWGQKGYGRYRLHPRLDNEGKIIEILGVFDDITERREMEEALRESEANYRNLAENSLQGISIIQDQKYVFVNQAFADIVGRSCKEIYKLGPKAWEFVHPDDREYLMELADKRRQGDDISLTYKYRFVRPDGEVRWVEAFAKYIDYNGKLALQIVVIDITDREKAQAELRESQEMLQLVLKTIPQSVFWKDTNSVYLGCNDAFARLAGLSSPEEVVGKTDYDLPWLKEESESYIALDKQVIETGESIFGLVEQLHTADGQVVWSETTKVPLYDTQGNIIGVLGTLHDVTERQEKEEAIQHSEQKYRTLAESSLQGLAIITREGVRYANTALWKLLGIPEDSAEIPLIRPERFVHPEDRERVANIIIAKIERRPAANNLEFRIIDQSGNIRWVEGFASSMEFESEPAAQLVLIDITDRMAAEREVKSAKDRAELYIDIMSHDIRNHLQVIVNSATLMRTAADESTKDSFLNIINESIMRVSRLIDEVRATEELVNAPMRKRDLREALDLCIKALSQSSSTIRFHENTEVTKAEIEADSFLELLITNILVNAVEHNPNAPKSVWVRLYEEGNGYVITIADNGPGVSDTMKANLFDRSRRFGGLGLHQSQQIVEKYGGKIVVMDRVPGDYTQGAMFKIWIPKPTDLQ